jgi:dihydrofolate reductase/thymidylate synthase
MFAMILAADAAGGIGKDGVIPWYSAADMAQFKKRTINNIVVMGRRTWDSLPAARQPLPDRINVVITSDKAKFARENAQLADAKTATEVLVFDDICACVHELGQKKYKNQEKFVIGGASIYEFFVRNRMVHTIYLTKIKHNYGCDVFLSEEVQQMCEFSSMRPLLHEDTIIRDEIRSKKILLTEASEFYIDPIFQLKRPQVYISCSYEVFTYNNCEERAYLDLLRQILEHGDARNDRTGTGTLAIFGGRLEFNMANGLPLLTTKFMPLRVILGELLWFLRGATNSKQLEAQNINIWRGNSTREFLDKTGHTEYAEGDIGPMYFWQIFHFGAHYSGASTDYANLPAGQRGIDQFAQVLQLLKTDPFSRRITMTTYNPLDLDKGVLHPCHGLVIQFFCQKPKEDGPLLLSLQMYQRSADAFLGLPFNITSYALLLHIVAAKVGMTAHWLIMSLGDIHIYNNHIEQVILQLTRRPYPFPKITLDNLASEELGKLAPEQFKLLNYMYHPAIKGTMSV